jgi:hypothetical protein
MKTRRTEIQIETHEVKIVRPQSRQALARCRYCVEIVTALTLEQTAEVLEMEPADVFRLLEQQASSTSSI